MKKYLAIGLAIVLTLLAGCGGSDATGNADGVSEIVQQYENGDSEDIISSSESINATDDDSQDIENVSDTEKIIDNTEIKEAEEAADEDDQTQDEEAAVEEKQDQDIEETTPAYTITDISTIMYVKSSANVRSKPSKDDEKLGTLSTNEEVNVTGQVDNGWYRINYNGSEGYVSGDLLSTEKTVESVPDTNNNSGEGTGDAGITAPVTQDVQGNLVWVPTHGGTKYHITSSCSGMKDPIQMTQEQAEANGYTPCKRCY